MTARERLRIFFDSYYDARQYSRYSAPVESALGASQLPRHIEAQLTKDYHRVEKAFVLPSTKRPFGAELERRLSLGLSASSSGASTQYARHALEALKTWNIDGSVDPALFREIGPSALDSWEALATSRGSVRNFDASSAIDPDALERAITLAGLSPSVCNRRPWRVHAFDGALGRSVLKLQGGNTGFGNTVPMVLLITVDTQLFAGAQERYQAWIEGGIFAMNLVWGLHAEHLGTCFLNWSKRPSVTRALRRAASLDNNELPIVTIAVGHPHEGRQITRSPRRSIPEIFVDHRIG